MYTKNTAFSLLVCLLAGCASFKTTALYRFDNDSVVPECNNEKLKGLPVKLKVPSHVRVNIYEQQVILANTEEEVVEKKKAATTAAAKVKTSQAAIDKLSTDITDAKKAIVIAEKVIAKRKSELEAANALPNGSAAEMQLRTETIKQKTALVLLAENLLEQGQVAFDAATKTKEENLEKLKIELAMNEADAELAADDAVVKYRLVSFTPQQLVVETQLDYTDKIFLVDFRRPAAGILNLNEASMDDEQYFSKVQADVTERTLEDVGKALDTLKGTVTPPKPPLAMATGADTPPGSGNGSVNFQMSIVASKRFDISEPDWEARMNAFIDSKLNSQNGTFASDEVPATEVPVAALQVEE